MSGNTLDVFYHGSQVGTLAETRDRRIAFQYSDSWLKTGFSVSPISLPLKPGVFVPPTSSRAASHGMFGVFADSLPDSWGELLLDRYLHSIGIDGVTPLERLANVGATGMGALEYYPAKACEYQKSSLDYDEIAAECRNLLESKPSSQLDTLFSLGGSSGGTRPKIMIEQNGTHWIVKFPASKDPANSGKREYDYSLCAKDCGIIMTRTKLLPSRLCEGYFMTERFDRRGSEKILSVTAAGLLEADYRAPACDYETFMKMIIFLTKNERSQIEQMFRVMSFNVLTHNLDDHAKNFSLIFSEFTGWQLAPAYDLTYSDTFYGEHTTSVNGKGKNITDKDLVHVGTTAGMSSAQCQSILEEIQEKTLVLNRYLSEKPLKTRKKATIQERLDEIT